MTPDSISRRVAQIAAVVDDAESAHAMEDDLFGDVLAAIADGSCADPAGCAAEALKSLALDFERWCA